MLLSSSARVSCPRCSLRQQIRHASLIRRPKRPYTFTQLITLSDGSTFTHRTTSPQPIYRNTKDTKNSALWNPSSQKLLNIEEDEAGRLKRFRKRFGRGFDVEAMTDAVQHVSTNVISSVHHCKVMVLMYHIGRQRPGRHNGRAGRDESPRSHKRLR